MMTLLIQTFYVSYHIVQTTYKIYITNCDQVLSLWHFTCVLQEDIRSCIP